MVSLHDLSWQVDEPTYRADKALSYSILSKYDREGFKSIPTLFDSISTPSLTFGSLVDTLLTSPETFKDEYIVVKNVNLSDTVKLILEDIYNTTKEKNLSDVPEEIIHDFCKKNNYYTDDKWAAKRKKEILLGEKYYNILHQCEGKKVITKELYDEAITCKEVILSNNYISKYFTKDPFDYYENFYQLKFKGNYEGVELRCMLDCIHVDYQNKIITPIDLKTTSKPEYEFPNSFITYRYGIQAQLYYHLLKETLAKNDYFKDFTIENYKFIVINKNSLNPLIWSFSQTVNEGYTLGDKEFRFWGDIAKELNFYLSNKSKYPMWVKPDNNIEEFFNIE